MRARILILVFVVLISGVSALKITEFESNPEGTDAGNEWIELYNDGEISLEGYKLVNNDGGEIFLNESFSGYFVYTFKKQWLDNSDEKVFLYENETLIDETDIFEDNKNNGLTWRLCQTWEFLNSTKGQENDCGKESSEEGSEEANEIVETTEETEEAQGTGKIIKEIEESSPRETGPLELKIITLNPKVIKSENGKEDLNKNNYAIYGFVLFSVLLGVLFILRKNRYNKNEFR